MEKQGWRRIKDVRRRIMDENVNDGKGDEC